MKVCARAESAEWLSGFVKIYVNLLEPWDIIWMFPVQLQPPSPIFMLFFISLFLGVRTETLRAAVVGLAHESVTAGEPFHLFPVLSADLILGVVAQGEVGACRVGDVHRIKPSVGTTIIRHGVVSMRRMAHIVIPIVIFVIPVHTIPSDRNSHKRPQTANFSIPCVCKHIGSPLSNLLFYQRTNSIDAIITDSGYTCLNKHYKQGNARKRNRDRHIGFQTRDIDNELLGQFHRVLKPSGHFFSFLPADAKHTLEYNNHFINMATDAGFQFNKRFIWDKLRIGMGYNGRNRYEQILFLSKGKRRMPCDLSIPDVLAHKTIHPSKRIHHAQKPVELIKDIIRFSTQKGETILDPFGDSMATARAGLALVRHTISIEIDPGAIQMSLKKRTDLTLSCF